ncbi:hypothetical protein ARMGADRAFT_822364 [Armillaria gallica]|uniref:DUF6535 domain-containing protein n=1 Tax=Armillaria gallica TaxID=47427 RepID=A0A2H3CNF5_ARMGA|nr:hypothetical protein ARMGADRAFT_822364 [Armillaria gallica]
MMYFHSTCKPRRQGSLEMARRDEFLHRHIVPLRAEVDAVYSRGMFLHLDDYSERYIERDGEGLGLGTKCLVSLLLEPLCICTTDMLEGWRDGLDVLLVFVGLFSAVFTTFSQTLQNLPVDDDQTSLF